MVVTFNLKTVNPVRLSRRARWPMCRWAMVPCSMRSPGSTTYSYLKQLEKRRRMFHVNQLGARRDVQAGSAPKLDGGSSTKRSRTRTSWTSREIRNLASSAAAGSTEELAVRARRAHELSCDGKRPPGSPPRTMADTANAGTRRHGGCVSAGCPSGGRRPASGGTADKSPVPGVQPMHRLNLSAPDSDAPAERRRLRPARPIRCGWRIAADPASTMDVSEVRRHPTGHRRLSRLRAMGGLGAGPRRVGGRQLSLQRPESVLGKTARPAWSAGVAALRQSRAHPDVAVGGRLMSPLGEQLAAEGGRTRITFCASQLPGLPCYRCVIVVQPSFRSRPDHADCRAPAH